VSHLHPQHHGPVLGELDKVAKVRAHCIASRRIVSPCIVSCRVASHRCRLSPCRWC
jgi:hypothetical protein